MSGEVFHIAIFDEIDPAAEAIDRLRKVGLTDDSIHILSGLPHSPAAFGRAQSQTKVAYYGAAGLLFGMLIAALIVVGTPLQYPIEVGGQPLMPIPTLLVFAFELGMMGLMIATFLGVLWENGFPSFTARIYHPDVSEGKTALVLECDEEMLGGVRQELAGLEVEWVETAEVKAI